MDKSVATDALAQLSQLRTLRLQNTISFDQLPANSSSMHKNSQISNLTCCTMGPEHANDCESHVSEQKISHSSSVACTKSNISSSQPQAQASTALMVSDTQPVIQSRNSQSSVRHLTCFWWKEKGTCRYNDDDCLYAHHDTGHYTDPPRQIFPGEPAMAGRKLERTMRNLQTVNRCSEVSSTGSRHGSRPGTPILDYNSPQHSPSPAYISEKDLTQLSNDNNFLRVVVEQGQKEKAIMISHIEELKTRNNNLVDDARKSKEDNMQLLEQCQNLRLQVRSLEERLTSTVAPVCHFGVVGRPRVNTETRCLGGLLSEDE